MNRVAPLLVLALLLFSCDDTSVNANNSNPTTVILVPAPDFSALVGANVTFEGSVEDGVTSPLDLEVSWSSSVDGILNEDRADGDGDVTFSTDSLSVGEHTITLRAVDPAGASGVDAISITIEEPQVENTVPTCAITAPEDDAEFDEGDTVLLEGTASDEQSPATALVATWSSSEDGDIGTASPSSSGAIALPASDLTPGTHVITLDVADPEGLNCSEFVVITVIPANYPPTVGPPTISPDPLYTDTDASCVAPTPTDVEGDATTVELRWLVNGADPGVSGGSLASSTFIKGDAVQCVATPSDATGTGAPATSPTVTVSDSPPTAPVLSISPATPTEATDDLVCSISTPSNDLDSDPVTYTFAWSTGGSPYTGPTIQTSLAGDTVEAANVTGGDWTCTATPTAAGLTGPDGTATVQVTPLNLPPSIGTPNITPVPLFTSSTATCNTPTPTDPEGDPVTVAVTWLVNGASPGVGGTSLSGTYFNKGESVQCVATPSDATSAGTPMASTAVVVSDTPPSQPGVSLAPGAPVEATDDLICSVSTASTDVDGDSVSYTMAWTYAAAPYTGPTSQTTLPGDTVPASSLGAGTWTCTVTPVAAGLAGTPAAATIQVAPLNLRPSIGAPNITPSPLLTDSTATCNTPTPSDPEGDAVTVGITWLVNGGDPGVTGSTLGSTNFNKGDSVQCVATPSDFGGAGASSTSPSVTVADTPPTQPGVSISPASPTEGADALVCSVSTASTDADNEAITYVVAWTYSGSAWTGATTTTTITGDTIPGAATSAGAYECTITPMAASVSGPPGSASVTVNPPAPVGKIVFITSSQQNGNLGGVNGADNVCQARANEAGLPGTYKAWLSGASYSSSPASRFTRSTSLPYVRTDGAVVADDWADLTDGDIQNPINVDENGVSRTSPSLVWSFTRIDGSPGLFGNQNYSCYSGDCHCNNWTTTQTNNPTQGSAFSLANDVDDDWTDYSYANACGSNYRLKCFQQ